MAAKESAVDPSRLMIITRVIDAPAQLVFEAWTHPDHLKYWWGPSGFATTTSAFELASGGTWRFVMHGPEGTDYENRIVFEEVTPAKRLVYHHEDGGGCNQFQTIVTFEEIDGKTRVTLQAEFPSAEERDRVLREHGAEEGGRQTLDRLGVYVAGMRVGRR